jgi:diguanylate cyclase (GGDEF)-like protein/PAS domain S-box-containing protein
MLNTYSQEQSEVLTIDQVVTLKAQFDMLINQLSQNQDSKLGELIKEQEHARDIIENSKIVIFEWTLEIDQPTKYVSKNIEQFGYTPYDFYEGALKDYWEFVYIDDREIAKKNVYTARSLPIEEFRHSYRIVTKENHIRWIEERIIFERDRGGLVLNEKGILLDITEIKDLETRLKQSKERFEKLFENAAALIFTVDNTGIISSANKKFLGTFDYRRGDLKRVKFLDLLTDAFKEQFTKLDVVKFAEAYRSKPFELEMINSKGECYVFSASVSILEVSQVTFEIEFIAFDVTEKKRVEQEVIYLSYHDKLTGCFNRAYFDEELERVDALQEFPYTIIVGDMNGLKEVNDLMGHRAGDQLLIRVSEIIKQSCREQDVVVRFGGDEFAIICPKTNDEGAASIISRVHEACALESNYIVKPSIALGAATKKDIFVTAEEIFKSADRAMYLDKDLRSSGRRSTLIGSLHHTLEGHTSEPKIHIEHIQDCSKTIGELLGLQSSIMEELNLAAMLHDMGKVFVPEDLLLKAQDLSVKELDLIKSHSELGHQILSASNITVGVAEYVLYHHERWDGLGYPKGLKGQDIPQLARIISISDAFVSMMEERTFRQSKSFEEAMVELTKGSETQFDPQLVKLILTHQEKFKELVQTKSE